MDKVALLEAVAEHWNACGIPYVVVHGLEKYPERIGRDLDVLVGSSRMREVIDAAQDVLERHGLHVMRPPRLWGERLVAASFEPEPDLLEIHAVDRISWRAAILADHPRPSQRLGPFAVDPWARFAKRILLPALTKDAGRVVRELEQHPLQDAEMAAAVTRLPVMLGESLAASFQQALHAADAGKITALAGPMRRATTWRACTRAPGAALMSMRQRVSRRIRQPYSPCGPVVCIAGPPGSGKTSLQQAICHGDRLVFTRCVTVRWATPKRAARSAWRHWISLAGHLCRAVRRAILDRLHSSRQQIVIYEGCALDLVINPARFGLRSSTGARLCWQLLPSPDVIVLLELSPVLLRERRPELPLQQVADEYAAWRVHLAGLASAVFLRADSPLETQRAAVTRHIVEAFTRRNSIRQTGTCESTYDESAR